MLYNTSHPRSRGYTLLETLVALAILMAVIVPLTTIFYKNTNAVRVRQSFVAQCLLEQESALAATFPEDVVPVKRRTIDSVEWIVKTDVAGKDPLAYTMRAIFANREAGMIIFYGRGTDAVKK